MGAEIYHFSSSCYNIHTKSFGRKKNIMMSSKLFLLLGLSLAVSLLIASDVSARDLADTTVHASSDTTGAEKTDVHIDGYGHGGHYGGGGGGGHYGGGGGGHCKHGCCGGGYHGSCKCCGYKGEAADIAAAAKP